VLFHHHAIYLRLRCTILPRLIVDEAQDASLLQLQKYFLKRENGAGVSLMLHAGSTDQGFYLENPDQRS
jgi:hypothetical protein